MSIENKDKSGEKPKSKKQNTNEYIHSNSTKLYLAQQKFIRDQKFEVLLKRANLVKNKKVLIEVKQCQYLVKDIKVEVEFGDIAFYKFPDINNIFICKPGVTKGDFNHKIDHVNHIDLAWVVYNDDRPLEISFWLGFPAIRLEVYMDIKDKSGEFIEQFDQFPEDQRPLLCRPSFYTKGVLTIL